jgi:hypothetical protein
MRRRATGVALAGVGVLVARALAPKLHARLIAGCERMFEQMPDTFPPKRMMRGIEEIRATSARTLALLEAREQASEAETPRETRLGRNGERARRVRHDHPQARAAADA